MARDFVRRASGPGEKIGARLGRVFRRPQDHGRVEHHRVVEIYPEGVAHARTIDIRQPARDVHKVLELARRLERGVVDAVECNVRVDELERRPLEPRGDVASSESDASFSQKKGQESRSLIAPFGSLRARGAA